MDLFVLPNHRAAVTCCCLNLITTCRVPVVLRICFLDLLLCALLHHVDISVACANGRHGWTDRNPKTKECRSCVITKGKEEGGKGRCVRVLRVKKKEAIVGEFIGVVDASSCMHRVESICLRIINNSNDCFISG